MAPIGPSSIPDSHLWSDIHDIPTVDSTGPNTVPVVDLTAPDAANLVGKACESWGVFQVINHGIPIHLIEKLDSESHRLFALPTEVKMKAASSSTPGSLEGYQAGQSIFLPSPFAKTLWMERFTVGGSLYEYAGKLWPEDPSQFCDVAEEYLKKMIQLTRNLLQLMLLSLGLTEEDINQADPIGFSKDVSSPRFRLNWYPACPEPDWAIGLAPHTDSILLAILYNSSPGLQVLHGPDQYGPSRWVNVPPLPGALVVNVGDMAHILSNGRFINVVHRVLVNQAQGRLSATYSQGPPDNFIVSPVVRGLTSRPVYRPMTSREFMEIKQKQTNFENTIPFIKVGEGEDDEKSVPVVGCAGKDEDKEKGVSVVGCVEGE